MTIRILQAGPGSQQVPASPNGSPALRGIIVAGTTPPGSTAGETATTLALGQSRIVLPAPPSGLPGTEVMFQILEARVPAAPHGANIEDLHRDFLRLGTDWHALKEAVNVLARPEPPPGSGGELAVPRPGARMAASVLFFMAALKGGDLHGWLGHAGADQLARAGQAPLLGQLADDFAAMARHAGDAGPSGWHALAVPVAVGTHVEQFRLYYRRQGRQDGGDEQDATHFMVEADLSRVGLLQLEGFVRPQRFDLTIHSAAHLGEPMQTDIRHIFLEALSAGDFAGTLRFDVGPTTPFSPPGAAPRPGRHNTEVVV